VLLDPPHGKLKVRRDRTPGLPPLIGAKAGSIKRPRHLALTQAEPFPTLRTRVQYISSKREEATQADTGSPRCRLVKDVKTPAQNGGRLAKKVKILRGGPAPSN